MGFGGLLRVSAERLESRELLKFLFDRLDPQTMVISVTKEKRIHVTPFAVKQVLDLPNDGEDIDLHTPAQQSKSLSDFKTLVGLAESQDLHASHLKKILEDDHKFGYALIDNDMAIRFFFIIACNKFLFPSTDNNIRCKDIYLTRDLSCLPGLNWCKAVVDDLRDAAVAWRVDKGKKSHSGCAIFLIILYLDNLHCKHQIAHTDTPRAKYFDQNVIKNIISADRTKDQHGKTTFGLLPLRNSNNTCYHTTNHPSADVPPEPLAGTHFPSLQVELHGLVAQISSSSRKSQALLALANFDSKAKKASGYMNMGQNILQDAHQKVIHTLRPSPTGDVDMYERHSVQNIAPEHVSNVPIHQPETSEFDMIFDGHTNQVPSQGISVDVQQNTNQAQLLPTVYTDVTIDRVVPPAAGISHQQAATTDMTTSGASIVPLTDMQVTDEENDGLHMGMDVLRFTQMLRLILSGRLLLTDMQVTDEENDGLHMGMEGELSPVCTQVYTDVTTEHTVPPKASTTVMTTSEANVVPQTHKKVTDEECRITQMMPWALHFPEAALKTRPPTVQAPMTKAHAVRKKFHAGMKWKSDIFIKAGSRKFSGEQILDTFIDAEMLSTQFMSFFVACISHDERHMADGGGYRVFLSQELGEYVNIEEDPDISQWESPAALAVLQRDIGDLDPTKVKLFLLPLMEEEHYSVYCINFIHDRIDVLDSSAEHHTVYHQVLGDRIIRRLNLLFQEATNGKMKEFTRFKRPIIDACLQSHDNDCGLYALKFMELWNGDSFHVPILTGKTDNYKSQLLFYGLYHTLNEIKKLPAGLEAHRPRQ
ncbi:unnamed protein product [Urochloa decumbens]|uniref:Ubiquitin-like protease family profile domain-containing protein n=1 Tax=Urochloa decumbens TaxID=240449 RepID=A0ABC9EKT8_9POAL